MAPNPKIAKAFRAMKVLGIREEVVKPVLKNLLKLYDKNWQLIEEENYRVLADAIFDSEETQAAEETKKRRDCDQGEYLDEGAQINDDIKLPLKRTRLRDQEVQNLSFGDPKSKMGETSYSQLKECKQPQGCSMQPSQEMIVSDTPNLTTESQPSNRQLRPRGKNPAFPKSLPAQENDSPSSQLRLRNKGKEPLHPHVSPKENISINEKSAHTVKFKEPKVEPGIVLLPKKKVVKTPVLIKPKNEPVTDDMTQYEIPIAILPPDSSYQLNSSVGNNANNRADYRESPASHCVYGEGEPDARGLSGDEETSSIPPNGSLSVEVALPEILTVPPSINGTADHLVHEKNDRVNGFCVTNTEGKITRLDDEKSCSFMGKKKKKSVDEEILHSLVIVNQHHMTADEMRTLFDRNDITRGEERVKISLVNEVNNDQPPSFHYIPKNLVYQNAYVNFSLARIGDEDCCSTCFGDCLSSEIPCACAQETGGEFAYTSDGLVKEELLEECISMNRDPEKHKHFYCKDCPLERSTNDDMTEPCKGHLVRKFIKECWSKCGCGKQCGNRIVQRGITSNLQIFMTAGKGWGIRTLEDLPKGAFVFEYVGEVLTNSELFDRNMGSTGSHSYPVLLDADWSAENVLKDEEALCLDATHYGNVARFLNHRCLDANMVEIPVAVETPDHHYYHLAFFTTRKVSAMEELTWDYGIDFDDHDHPVKAFRCKCGSRFCRNIKRSHRRSAR